MPYSFFLCCLDLTLGLARVLSLDETMFRRFEEPRATVAEGRRCALRRCGHTRRDADKKLNAAGLDHRERLEAELHDNEQQNDPAKNPTCTLDKVPPVDSKRHTASLFRDNVIGELVCSFAEEIGWAVEKQDLTGKAMYVADACAQVQDLMTSKHARVRMEDTCKRPEGDRLWSRKGGQVSGVQAHGRYIEAQVNSIDEGKTQSALIMDHCSSHCTAEVKAAVLDAGNIILYVPRRRTVQLQVLDLCFSAVQGRRASRGPAGPGRARTHPRLSRQGPVADLAAAVARLQGALALRALLSTVEMLACLGVPPE